MIWLAVDSDGKEHIFNQPLIRYTIKNREQFKGSVSIMEYQSNVDIWIVDTNLEYCLFPKIELPKGTIKKITGKELSWNDEPIKQE